MRELGVLAFDDDKEILSVIERWLGHFGIRVDCVDGAGKALAG